MDLGAAAVMIAPPPHLRTDDEITGYFAGAAEAIGPDVPWVLQDYPLTLTVVMTPAVIRPSSGQPRLRDAQARGLAGPGEDHAPCAASSARAPAPVSILTGNGGLFLDFEMERGADGAMTGYAFPEMLVDVVRMPAAGERDAAHDLFDAHLPLLRYEQQARIGLAVRKWVLMRRGLIASDAQRKPGPGISATAKEEVEFLLKRLARVDRRAAVGMTEARAA